MDHVETVLASEDGATAGGEAPEKRISTKHLCCVVLFCFVLVLCSCLTLPCLVLSLSLPQNSSGRGLLGDRGGRSLTGPRHSRKAPQVVRRA